MPWVPAALVWATVRVVGGTRTPRQLTASGVLAVGYLVVAGAVPGTTVSAGSPVTAVLGAAVPLLGGVCVGLLARLRRARRDRAVADRAALAYRTRVDERQRVAAEVHDTLGYVLTLLVLHADALASGAADPATREAAERMSGARPV